MKTTLMSAVLAIVLTGAARSQQTPMYDDRPKITVVGEAVINVKPDKIVITFGIETSDADVNVAKQKNSELMKKAGNVSAAVIGGWSAAKPRPSIRGERLRAHRNLSSGFTTFSDGTARPSIPRKCNCSRWTRAEKPPTNRNQAPANNHA